MRAVLPSTDSVRLPLESRNRTFDLGTGGPLFILSPILLLVLWELAARVGLMDVRFFPAPSTVAIVFWEQILSGSWFINVGATLARVLGGFVVGSALGILVGAWMGLMPFVRLLLYPLIAAIYPIPKIAIFPLILLIFGLGETSKMITITASCFFFLAMSAMSGVLNIPRVYMDVGRNFGAGRVDFIRTIAIPAALPAVFSGLRLALGAAFLVVVSIEFISAQQGIGWLIWHSWELFSIQLMFVGLLTVSGLGLGLMFLLDWIEKRVVPWRT